VPKGLESRDPRPAVEPDELWGFLTSVEHRLAARRRAGHAEPEWEAKARRARTFAEAGRWSQAERLMRTVDAHLRSTEPEAELREFPRGLVGYVPQGERGAPTPEEEDALRNRVAIASRLLDLRRGEGYDVTEPWRELRDAEAALRAGDRRTARQRCDAALGALERLERPRQQD
jgi:hypothetical protein